MALVTSGANALASLMIGDAAIAAYNNANLKTGVGDSSAAVVNSQTDLQAATNKARVGMDASYPTRTGNAITGRSTFDGTTANWTWAEWAWFNAAAAGNMFNRVVAALGAKASGATWIFTTSVTIVAP